MGSGLPGSLPSYIHFILSTRPTCIFLRLIKIVVVVKSDSCYQCVIVIKICVGGLHAGGSVRHTRLQSVTAPAASCIKYG